MKQLMHIEHVAEVVPAADGLKIVVRAEARIGDQRTELELAIATELAATVAIALLATTAKARAARDGLEPALDVLAAAVVASGCADKVRIHLLFDKGAVLPVKVPVPAAKVLSRTLAEELVSLANGADIGALTARPS